MSSPSTPPAVVECALEDSTSGSDHDNRAERGGHTPDAWPHGERHVLRRKRVGAVMESAGTEASAADEVCVREDRSLTQRDTGAPAAARRVSLAAPPTDVCSRRRRFWVCASSVHTDATPAPRKAPDVTPSGSPGWTHARRRFSFQSPAPSEAHPPPTPSTNERQQPARPAASPGVYRTPAPKATSLLSASAERGGSSGTKRIRLCPDTPAAPKVDEHGAQGHAHPTPTVTAVSRIALTDSVRRRLLSRLHTPTVRSPEVDVDEAWGASATSAPPPVSDASSLSAAPVQLARMLASWESSRLSLLLPHEATTPGTDARMVRAVCARELGEWRARHGWVQVQITEITASPADRPPSDNPTAVQMTLARVTGKTPTDVAPSLPCGEVVLLLLPANAIAGMLEVGAQLLLPACFWHTSAWPSTAARPAMPWPVICAALAIRLGGGAGSPDEPRGKPQRGEPTDTPGHPAQAPPQRTRGRVHVHDLADLSGRLFLTQPYVSVRGRPRRRLPHGNAILVQDI
eukprot:ctg_83.g23